MRPRTTAEILIADDEEAITYCLGAYSRRLGLTVHLVPNGLSAVELIQQNGRIQAAFLDLFMPGLGGVQVFQQVHRLLRPPRCCFMTAFHHDPEIRAEFATLGVPVLCKPFGLEEFNAVLAQFLADNTEGEPSLPDRLVGLPLIAPYFFVQQSG